MRKSIIVAAAQNGVIGKDGKLPWHLPGDLKRFKELTMGHTLVMGRKTYESLPPKLRPLPGRTTITLSRTVVNLPLNNGFLTASSMASALDLAERVELTNRLHEEDNLSPEVFVCGGGEIYREAMPLCDRVYLTVVERDFDGDTEIEIPFWNQHVLPKTVVAFARGSWCLINTERVEGELPHRFEIWDRVR